MRATRPTSESKPVMTVGFYLSVHHKIWVVFDAYDEALDGLKATVEILSDQAFSDEMHRHTRA